MKLFRSFLPVIAISLVFAAMQILPDATVAIAQKEEAPEPAPADGEKPADPENKKFTATPTDGYKARLDTKSANAKNIKAALEWLKDHQHEGGGWRAQKYKEDSSRIGSKSTNNIEMLNVGELDGDIGWKDDVDIGLTGLALLAFAGDGHDHYHGEYTDTVRSAVKFLLLLQTENGCIGPMKDDHAVYSHAIATMALAEIYGMTQDPDLKPAVENAVQFILSARNSGAGWRYGVKSGQNDSSITGWMVLSLKSAMLAGIEFEHKEVFNDTEKLFVALSKVVDNNPPAKKKKVPGEEEPAKKKHKPDMKLRVGYKTAGSHNARLRNALMFKTNWTLEAVYVYSLLAMDKRKNTSKDIKKLTGYFTDKSELPVWELNKIDYYCWYYTALATYQVGGKYWTAWKKKSLKLLKTHQRGFHKLDKKEKLTTKEMLDEHGSWDPLGPWADAGGRVYSTAINCLTLEIDKRYPRAKKKKK
ncbi:MAG: prenyltransferase/squalene oxidase repeat-containing protein [Planctomycetota bacterium]